MSDLRSLFQMDFGKKRIAAHAWEGCCSRNTYAVVWAPRLRSWVRIVWFGEDEYVALNLKNEVLR